MNPPKILLVTPPCLDARINDEDAGIVPIGLYYIAALMIKKRVSHPHFEPCRPGSTPGGV